MKSFEVFRAEVREWKRLHWAGILNGEPPGRVPGRRPRDPEQDARLTEADRRRIARSEWLANGEREPVEPED